MGGSDECSASYVSSVIGYPANTSGTVAPTVTITSTNTVDAYAGMATDSSGNIYVSSAGLQYAGGEQSCTVIPGSEKVMVFAPPASGAVAANPIRTISIGVPPTNFLAVDSAGNIYTTTAGAILEFAAGAGGNAVPLRTIKLPIPEKTLALQGNATPEGLAVDSNGNIVIALSAGTTCCAAGTSVPAGPDTIEVFTPTQSGNATPARTIAATQDSQNLQISGLGLDPAGNIYASTSAYYPALVSNELPPAILEFAGGATGGSTPIGTISGDNTQLAVVGGRAFTGYPGSSCLTLDAAGNIYYVTSSLLRFEAGATGNATPSVEMFPDACSIAVH